MGLGTTAGAFAACLVVLVGAAIVDRRPYRPGKHNLIWLMMIMLAFCLVLGRHLLTFAV